MRTVENLEEKIKGMEKKGGEDMKKMREKVSEQSKKIHTLEALNKNTKNLTSTFENKNLQNQQ